MYSFFSSDPNILTDPCQLSGEAKGNHRGRDMDGTNSISTQASEAISPDALHRHPEDKQGDYMIWNRSGWKVNGFLATVSSVLLGLLTMNITFSLGDLG